jgi:hypothetical protein
LPRILPTKETFGDIDILVYPKDGNNQDFDPRKDSEFRSTQALDNNNSLHFEYHGVQVDIL